MSEACPWDMWEGSASQLTPPRLPQRLLPASWLPCPVAFNPALVQYFEPAGLTGRNIANGAESVSFVAWRKGGCSSKNCRARSRLRATLPEPWHSNNRSGCQSSSLRSKDSWVPTEAIHGPGLPGAVLEDAKSVSAYSGMGRPTYRPRSHAKLKLPRLFLQHASSCLCPTCFRWHLG